MPGVGIDLIEIERIERVLERRPRLAERLFTPAELTYALERARPGRHLAARFAAKEAVIKALAAPAVGPAQIEIVAGAPPTVRLSGRAAEAAGGDQISVSLTHSEQAAAAIAIRG
jgi:holo-[acyl-carrier protein] synthase